jgi:hypothetical protein
MLSVETRVNGSLVGTAFVYNELSLDDNIEGECLYSVEYHRINKEPPVIKFKVKHRREEGIEKLSFLIYRRLDQRLKKESNPKGQ